MTPLPAAFLNALDRHEEVLVTSREGRRERSVPVWYVVTPPGVLYLFSFAFSLRVARWRVDPWVRLRVPGTQVTAEGVVRFLAEDEIDPVAPLVIRRWQDWGATTVEGLRRMLKDKTHVLMRVEGQPAVG